MVRGVVFIRAIGNIGGRQRRLLGQQWLYQAVSAYGHPEVTAQSHPILRTERGKPYFAEEMGIYFSISHSKDYWACVLADGPVGLDLQYHKEGRLDQIPGRFFHPQEALWLKGQEARTAFFEIWTAKESYVKWTGEGIDRHFKEIAVADESGLREQTGEAFFWRGDVIPDYSLCLCGGQPWDDVKIMKMEENDVVLWI